MTDIAENIANTPQIQKINTVEHSISIRHTKDHVLTLLNNLLSKIKNNENNIKMNIPHDNFIEEFNLNKLMASCHDVSDNANYDNKYSNINYFYYPYTVSCWYNNNYENIMPVTMEYIYDIEYNKKKYYLTEYRTNDIHTQTSLECYNDNHSTEYWFNI